MAKKYPGLKKVDVNSICPNTRNGCHQWTTYENVSEKTGLTRHTWCKACSSVPK